MNPAKAHTAVVVVHESITPSGPGHNLREYLQHSYGATVLFIAHPLLYIKECYAHSSYKEINGQNSLKRTTAPHFVLPEPLLYIKDVVYSFFWTLFSGRKYELYVGLDPLNALPGILLSWLGRVDKTVYYSIDYFPNRFANPLMNTLYHSLDTFCVGFCDETWNASGQMKQARSKNGMNGKRYERQFHVPMGIWFHKAKRLPEKKVKMMKLLFIGHLVDFMGVDLPIRALPELIKKFPKIHLDIIGGGEAEDSLKKLVSELQLSKSVTFHGWVKTESERERLLADGAIGLATFNTEILDDKVKNADPIKIKEYTQYGMPVIVTDAISSKKDIIQKKAGIVIPYSTTHFIQAVTTLLSNKNTYQKYRAQALNFSKSYDWNAIFDKNLPRLIKRRYGI